MESIEQLSAKVDYIEKDIEQNIKRDISDLKHEVKDFTEVKTQIKLLGQTVDTLARETNASIDRLSRMMESQVQKSQEDSEKSNQFQQEVLTRLNNVEDKEANEALANARIFRTKVYDYILKGVVALIMLGAATWVGSCL